MLEDFKTRGEKLEFCKEMKNTLISGPGQKQGMGTNGIRVYLKKLEMRDNNLKLKNP